MLKRKPKWKKEIENMTDVELAALAASSWLAVDIYRIRYAQAVIDRRATSTKPANGRTRLWIAMAAIAVALIALGRTILLLSKG